MHYIQLIENKPKKISIDNDDTNIANNNLSIEKKILKKCN